MKRGVERQRMTAGRTQGFTLIEILSVLAIIGVLAAMLIPTLTHSKTRPYDAAALSCGRMLITALYMYENEHEAFTADLSALDQGPLKACRDIEIQSGSAAGGATVTGDGGLTLTEKGVAFTVWSRYGSRAYHTDLEHNIVNQETGRF